MRDKSNMKLFLTISGNGDATHANKTPDKLHISRNFMLIYRCALCRGSVFVQDILNDRH